MKRSMLSRRHLRSSLATLLLALAPFTVSHAAGATPDAADNGQAEIGQDGWLVYRGNLPDYRRGRIFSEQELAGMGKDFLALEARLNERGSKLLWVIAPNTTTIYPESVPARTRVASNPSRREQLAALMNQVRPQGFLDLNDALMREKPRHTLYRKTDTHWNDMGAYVGYREIVQRLAALRPEFSKNLQAIGLENFRQEVRTSKEGDLAKMMGLQDELGEESLFLTPLKPRQAALQQHAVWDPAAPATRPVPPRNETITSENPKACPGPTATIYRDSFGNALLPFLLEHFCKATVIWYRNGSVDLAQVERSKPDFVILMNVERMIHLGAKAMASE